MRSSRDAYGHTSVKTRRASRPAVPVNVNPRLSMAMTESKYSFVKTCVVPLAAYSCEPWEHPKSTANARNGFLQTLQVHAGSRCSSALKKELTCTMTHDSLESSTVTNRDFRAAMRAASAPCSSACEHAAAQHGCFIHALAIRTARWSKAKRCTPFRELTSSSCAAVIAAQAEDIPSTKLS